MVERSMSEQIRDVLGAGREVVIRKREAGRIEVEVGETRAREAAAAAPKQSPAAVWRATVSGGSALIQRLLALSDPARTRRARCRLCRL